MSYFRNNAWDPILIIFQIICVQSIYYISVCTITAVFDGLFGYQIEIQQIFDFTVFKFKEPQGKILLVANLVGSLSCAIALLFVVQRTKQCLDFACTIHFYHLIACCVYTNQFPTSFLWWTSLSVSTLLTTVIGEYLCMQSELKAIPIGGNSITSNVIHNH